MITKTAAKPSPREAILDYFERQPSARVRCGTLAKSLKLNGTACAEALNRLSASPGSRLRRKMTAVSDEERGDLGLKEQWLYWMEPASEGGGVGAGADPGHGVVEPAAEELPIPSVHAGKAAYRGVGKLSPRAQDALLGCPGIPDISETSANGEMVTASTAAGVVTTPVPLPYHCTTPVIADPELQEAPVVGPITDSVEPEAPEPVLDEALLETHLAAIHHKDVAIRALEADLSAEVDRTIHARAKAARAEQQVERLLEELHALKGTLMQRPPVAIQPAAVLGDPEGYIVGDRELARFGLACEAQDWAFKLAADTNLPAPVYALHLVGQVVPVVRVEWRDAKPEVAAVAAAAA